MSLFSGCSGRRLVVFMDTYIIDFVAISAAGFIAVNSLVRLMQVYRQRLIFETREILLARVSPKVSGDGEAEGVGG